MIPTIIHYCWFGPNEKNAEIKRCLKSWETLLPEFTIKEWTEDNFDVSTSDFTKKMYEEKKWAFVADYARLQILEEEGGFWLDTDMLLVQSISPLTAHACVLGEESPGIISAGMIGAEPHHPFIQACKKYYDDNASQVITIPRALTQVFASYEKKNELTIFPPRAFYPYDSMHIKEYKGQDLGGEVYGVHLWNYSWGHPLNKFFKKIGVYSLGKKIVERSGIKQLLKKLLGFI